MSSKYSEKLIYTIINLSNKLQHIDELPQIWISFQQQQKKTLKFHAVILRILKPNEPNISLQKLSKLLPQTIKIIPERIANVGTLEGNYIKEANVFSLEVDSSPFLRQHHSIDLVQAHKFVAQALEKMVGPYHLHEDRDISQIAESSQETFHRNQNVLHLHLPRAAQSLDPRGGGDRTSGIVIKMLYEGLCRVKEDGEVELALAKEVEISEDKRKYVFKLKHTNWSNGSELTAYDFEYAWKKALEPDFGSPYSFLFFPIKNAESAKKGEKSLQQVGIQALDNHTLHIQLEYPASFFLELTANWFYSPLCRSIDQAHPGWAYHNHETYVCNGPFKLEAWQHNDNLSFVKNPTYWDASNVRLERIKISIIEDEKKALELFDQKQLDWVGDPLSKISPSAIPSLKKKGILHCDTHNFGLFWIQLNIATPPFHNAKIRRAFACGTKRQEIIEQVLDNQARPAFSYSYKDFTLPALFQDGDIENAQQLFQEGLKEMQMSIDTFPTIIITHSEIEEQEAISRALGAQWSKLFGIKVKYERLVWNTYFEALNRNELMLGCLAWYTRCCDPLYFYNLLVFKEHTVRTTTWKNSAYQQLIEKAKQSADPAKQERILLEAEKILADAMPVIPLFFQYFRYVKNPHLQGYILSNTNQIDFRNAYFEQ